MQLRHPRPSEPAMRQRHPGDQSTFQIGRRRCPVRCAHWGAEPRLAVGEARDEESRRWRTGSRRWSQRPGLMLQGEPPARRGREGPSRGPRAPEPARCDGPGPRARLTAVALPLSPIGVARGRIGRTGVELCFCTAAVCFCRHRWDREDSRILVVFLSGCSHTIIFFRLFWPKTDVILVV